MFNKIISKILYRFRGIINLDTYIKQGLVIGKNCSIQSGVTFDYSHSWHIIIGDNVTIAPGARILAHDASMKRHLNYTRIGKVIIYNNVFIGAGSIILPGVTIGENSIIGAGSVVAKNVPENVVVAGNPIREIYKLDKFLAKCKEEMKNVPVFNEDYTIKRNISKGMKNEMNNKMINSIGYVI
jgi:maltose O-acetyltransferase